MSIQTRTTALQNEIVRLYCRFNRNGYLTNPATQPIIEIIDSDGCTILATVNATLESTGIFYADWYVPKNLPLGNYYDRWTFQWDANSSVQEMNMMFTVHSFDSYINFISRGLALKTSDKVNQLLNDLNNDFLYEAQHIPVYFEQGQRMQADGQQKRVKSYYYFTLDSNLYSAEEGAIYTNNGKNFTVFQTITPAIESSSSSNSSDYVPPSNSSSSSSSTSFEPDSDQEIVDETIMTMVGNGDPTASGTLTKHSGTGDTTIGYTAYEKRISRLSTMYNFAYRNWNQDPAPIVRLNNTIVDDGWHLDYDGKIYFDSLMSPEDSPNVMYNFRYFSTEEMLSFLNLGLGMMNGLPPASSAYRTLDISPFEWNPGILLYAAITGLKRLIFGWSFQEKRIIYGSPEAAQQAVSHWQDLYKEYQTLWAEFGKNVKTRKLPSIAMSIQPEYTLPGGRCLSSTTYINCLVDKVEKSMTIKEAYFVSLDKKIKVESNNNGSISFEDVGKIWKSGNKDTYVVKTNGEEIRLTSEHLVYLPEQSKFVNVGSMKAGDVVLVKRNEKLEQQKLINDPVLYGNEEVYDIEVPSTENFIGNGIVSHNSRWFRYLFKGNG